MLKMSASQVTGYSQTNRVHLIIGQILNVPITRSIALWKLLSNTKPLQRGIKNNQSSEHDGNFCSKTDTHNLFVFTHHSLSVTMFFEAKTFSLSSVLTGKVFLSLLPGSGIDFSLSRSDSHRLSIAFDEI